MSITLQIQLGNVLFQPCTTQGKLNHSLQSKNAGLENKRAHTNEPKLQPPQPFSQQTHSASPREGGRRDGERSLTPECLQCCFLFALPRQGALTSTSDWALPWRHWRSVHGLPGLGRQSSAKCKSRSKFLTMSLLGSISLILKVL